MQKIKDYVDRFFKSKKMDASYALRADEVIMFIKELYYVDGNGVFDVIVILFRYGYAKGYRAAKAEMKKGGVAA